MDQALSEAEAVAVEDYLFYFALLERREQQTLVIEWIKYSKKIG
jgi:hypothetical protein